MTIFYMLAGQGSFGLKGNIEGFCVKLMTTKRVLSVSKHEQEARFKRRLDDPLRQWKLSEVDLQAQDLWDEFTEMKYRWYVIRSDDKQQARLETIKLILSKIPYRGRTRSLDMCPNSAVIIPGDKEMTRMEKHRRKYGHFES
jgi:hypothetical protein